MATLFQNKYRIGFTRHAAWNYANSGMYFVTICTAGRICYFGNIINEKMRLNNIGSMAGQCWLEIPKHFPNVILDEYIIMPNHTHGIIFIDNDMPNHKRRDAIYRVSTGGITGKHNPMGTNSLGEIIRAYKSAVKRYCTKNNIRFFWQHRFYDRIVRNEHELRNVRDYIYYNPAKWDIDRNNFENLYV